MAGDGFAIPEGEDDGCCAEDVEGFEGELEEELEQ
jgi:hypothetical protein